MKNENITKMMAWVGTVLAWFPLAAPVILTLIVLIVYREFHFDYLMPAELFVFSIVGGGLLQWAALRAKQPWKWIAVALGAAVTLLVGMQGAAMLTGLAHGETAVGGWETTLVLFLLGLFWLALIWLALSGVRMIRRLKTPPIS